MGQRRMYGGKSTSKQSRGTYRQHNDKKLWKEAHAKQITTHNKKFFYMFIAGVLAFTLPVYIFPWAYLHINYDIEEVTILAHGTDEIDTNKIPNNLSESYRAIRKDGTTSIVYGNKKTLHWTPPYRAKVALRKNKNTYGEIIEINP